MDFFITFLMIPAILAAAGLIGGIIFFVVFGKNKNKIFMVSGILAFVLTFVCILHSAGFLLVYSVGGMLFSGEGSIEPGYRSNYNPDDDIDGVITEEPGIGEYIGWWRVEDGYDGDVPFVYIEIVDYYPANCYDGDGVFIDAGLVDASAQRALNGKEFIVFVFETIGEYGAQPFGIQDDDNEYMHITDYKGFEGTVIYLGEEPPDGF